MVCELLTCCANGICEMPRRGMGSIEEGRSHPGRLGRGYQCRYGAHDAARRSGSFTEPQYAQAGLTEAKAREMHDIVTSTFLSTGPRGQSSMSEHSAFAN